LATIPRDICSKPSKEQYSCLWVPEESPSTSRSSCSTTRRHVDSQCANLKKHKNITATVRGRECRPLPHTPPLDGKWIGGLHFLARQEFTALHNWEGRVRDAWTKGQTRPSPIPTTQNTSSRTASSAINDASTLPKVNHPNLMKHQTSQPQYRKGSCAPASVRPTMENGLGYSICPARQLFTVPEIEEYATEGRNWRDGYAHQQHNHQQHHQQLRTYLCQQNTFCTSVNAMRRQI
jgi:hypothetical protein